jgi:hypothetical protein
VRQHPRNSVGHKAIPGRDLELDTDEDPGCIPNGLRRQVQVGCGGETLHEVGDELSLASVAIDTEHLGQSRVDIGNGEVGS